MRGRGTVIVWLLGCLPVFAAVFPTATLGAAVDADVVARLRAHGLAASPAALVRFLEDGFAPATDMAGLPAEPALKSQLLLDAIVECARLQVVDASPILGRLMRGTLSEGIRTVLEWDVSQQRPSERRAFRERVLRRLRINAIVALGLIGDPERVYELNVVFEREKEPAFKMPAALALATMGSPVGLPYLVREVRRANRTTSVEAAAALKLITGIDYGPDPDAPVMRRREAARQWKAWWKSEGQTFRPRRDRVLARRVAPKVRPNPRVPATPRDLVDCMAYPEDRRWTIDGYIAYGRLRSTGAAAFEGLEQIIADKNENLRIRRQAILLYSQMSTAGYGGRSSEQARQAYRVIRRCRWDHNPEIREVVRECLRRLRASR